jgi:hypothetical protein
MILVGTGISIGTGIGIGVGAAAPTSGIVTAGLQCLLDPVNYPGTDIVLPDTSGNFNDGIKTGTGTFTVKGLYSYTGQFTNGEITCAGERRWDDEVRHLAVEFPEQLTVEIVRANHLLAAGDDLGPQFVHPHERRRPRASFFAFGLP